MDPIVLAAIILVVGGTFGAILVGVLFTPMHRRK